jgi:hypothetical protein
MLWRNPAILTGDAYLSLFAINKLFVIFNRTIEWRKYENLTGSDLKVPCRFIKISMVLSAGSTLIGL